MPKLNVLISGAGIAGPCCAWWLHKARLAANITVVERFAEPRTSGQAVDIRPVAVDLIKKMGLEETIRSKTTTEEGVEFVYMDGKTKARFPASGDTSAQSLTSEYEILRGDLARIFYDSTKEHVDYVFDEYVTEVQEKDGKVRVKFAKHLPEAKYDLVIGADGMISRTRRLVFGSGPDGNDYLRRLRSYWAYFTIPRIESDTRFAQWYITSKGRLIFTRPDQYGERRGYLAVTDWSPSRFEGLEKAKKEGQEAQQRWFAEQFAGAGWQSQRLVEGMKKAKDFYMQEMAQVRMEEFVKGRIALLGDAGYCPSAFSGVGTAMAIVGSYVLAGEISKSPSDIPKALQQYQQVLKPFITQCQQLPPGTPQIFFPQSELGVKLINFLGGLASNPLVKRFSSLFSGQTPITRNQWQVPKYPVFEG